MLTTCIHAVREAQSAVVAGRAGISGLSSTVLAHRPGSSPWLVALAHSFGDRFPERVSHSSQHQVKRGNGRLVVLASISQGHCTNSYVSRVMQCQLAGFDCGNTVEAVCKQCLCYFKRFEHLDTEVFCWSGYYVGS